MNDNKKSGPRRITSTGNFGRARNRSRTRVAIQERLRDPGPFTRYIPESGRYSFRPVGILGYLDQKSLDAETITNT